jgi:DNA helicase TIP49 (TBP-interacting protein)
MLTPSKILAGDHGTDANIVQDVENVDGLFLDGKASAQMLQHAEGFMA